MTTPTPVPPHPCSGCGADTPWTGLTYCGGAEGDLCSVCHQKHKELRMKVAVDSALKNAALEATGTCTLYFGSGFTCFCAPCNQDRQWREQRDIAVELEEPGADWYACYACPHRRPGEVPNRTNPGSSLPCATCHAKLAAERHATKSV